MILDLECLTDLLPLLGSLLVVPPLYPSLDEFSDLPLDVKEFILAWHRRTLAWIRRYGLHDGRDLLCYTELPIARLREWKRLGSPWWTHITYMVVHYDYSHLVTNLIALILSASGSVYAEVGALGVYATFLGGGICATTLGTTFSIGNEPNKPGTLAWDGTWNSFSSRLSSLFSAPYLGQNHRQLHCGCSAGVAALQGLSLGFQMQHLCALALSVVGDLGRACHDALAGSRPRKAIAASSSLTSAYRFLFGLRDGEGGVDGGRRRRDCPSSRATKQELVWQSVSVAQLVYLIWKEYQLAVRPGRGRTAGSDSLSVPFVDHSGHLAGFAFGVASYGAIAVARTAASSSSSFLK